MGTNHRSSRGAKRSISGLFKLFVCRHLGECNNHIGSGDDFRNQVEIGGLRTVRLPAINIGVRLLSKSDWMVFRIELVRISSLLSLLDREINIDVKLPAGL